LLVAAVSLGLIVTSIIPATGLPAPSPATTSAPPAPPPGPSAQEIEKERSALRQKITEADKQVASFSQQLADSDGRRLDLEKQNSSLVSKLKEAQFRLDLAESQLGEVGQELVTTETTLVDLSKRLAKVRTSFEQRTRNTYKLGGFGRYFALLLQADSFQQFVSRLFVVGKVITQDRSRILAVQRLSKEVKDTRLVAMARKDDISTEKLSIAEEKDNLAGAQAGLAENRQKVNAEVATRQALLSGTESQRAAYLKEAKRLETESNNIAALLKARPVTPVPAPSPVAKPASPLPPGATPTPLPSGLKPTPLPGLKPTPTTGTVPTASKNLLWPTAGSVSSPYGYRTHPVFGDTRLHTGIDISAPYGQSVKAAQAGTVVFAGTDEGYGSYIVIDHGQGFATLYAHLSSIGVSVGRSVARGAGIGAVGCSGYCTGPHLHFETRVNGDPVDPMQYF